jgi:hypothetical protein
VFFAVHLGMPLLGLKGLIVVGGVIDIALGLALLWRLGGGGRLAQWATAAGVAGVAATLAFVELDSFKMASGVYRHGGLLAREKTQIVFHRDGKTATVNMVQSPTRLSIHTNGKSDAALATVGGGVAPDEATMIMAAALPLAFLPQARTVANIGLGSGLTSHVFLASDTIREVDTIEIEPAIVEAARGFSPRNDNVYRDPRSRIHIEDAKTFFSSHNKRYDIIVSEPSNPWVSGVASLFTEEFYRHAKRHLNEGGLFVQWMQLYEINPALVASVFKALARHFPDYAVYSGFEGDVIVIARNGGALPAPSGAMFAQPRLARELARVEVRGLGDLGLHHVGNRKALQPWFESFAVSPNSDFFPVLDLNAAKARFMGAVAADVINVARTAVPAVEVLGGEARRGGVSVAPRPWLRRSEYTLQALAGRDYLLGGDARQLERVPAVLHSDFSLVRLLSIECAQPRRVASTDALFATAGALVPYLSRDEQRALWARLKSSPCASRMEGAQRDWIALFAAVGERDAQAMAQIAERLLRSSGGDDAGRKEYLVGAAVAGRLARGERGQAAALWGEFADRTITQSPNLMPRLLEAHLAAGNVKPRADDR